LAANMRATAAGAQGPSGFAVTLEGGVVVDVRGGVVVNVATSKPGVVDTVVCNTRVTVVQGNGLVVFVVAGGAAANGATVAQGGGFSTQHVSLSHFPFSQITVFCSLMKGNHHFGQV